MQKDVNMGVAGSLTMIFLTIAVVLLLRSFYKRFNRLQRNKDDKN
jgi:ABC-type sulfate transport system permease component